MLFVLLVSGGGGAGASVSWRVRLYAVYLVFGLKSHLVCWLFLTFSGRAPIPYVYIYIYICMCVAKLRSDEGRWKAVGAVLIGVCRVGLWRGLPFV